jgi:hypothetical protein
MVQCCQIISTIFRQINNKNSAPLNIYSWRLILLITIHDAIWLGEKFSKPVESSILKIKEI